MNAALHLTSPARAALSEFNVSVKPTPQDDSIRHALRTVALNSILVEAQSDATVTSLWTIQQPPGQWGDDQPSSKRRWLSPNPRGRLPPIEKNFFGTLE
jgi:hypothetical protein